MFKDILVTIGVMVAAIAVALVAHIAADAFRKFFGETATLGVLAAILFGGVLWFVRYG
jgi:hypothetical protein